MKRLTCIYILHIYTYIEREVTYKHLICKQLVWIHIYVYMYTYVHKRVVHVSQVTIHGRVHNLQSCLVYTYIYIYKYIYLYVYICTYIYVNIYSQPCICISLDLLTYLSLYIYVYSVCETT